MTEFKNKMTEYRNETEIVFHSLGRSGSHAIINWIASMFKEPVYFFNNCPLGDPYRARVRYWRRISKRPTEKFFVKFPHLKHNKIERDRCRNISKHCLMYSYEHEDIKTLKNGEFIQDRNFILGESRNRYNVLILRDIFNWFASCLKIREEWSLKFLGLWQIYAEEFLGKTNYLKEKKICISFNKWFIDEDYRIGIAGLFNLEYSDVTLDYAGSPSSFDKKKYKHGKAQEMKALDRWKTLRDDSKYCEYLDALPEARELSYKIFGKEIGYDILDNFSIRNK